MRTLDIEGRLEEFLTEYLEDHTYEEFLEEFDMTPFDSFRNHYYSGLIDDNDLDRVFPRLVE